MKKKPYPINGSEEDCCYARKIYCYLKNNHNNVKFIKKTMNKRFRKQANEQLIKELEEILQSKETYDPEYPTVSISDAIEAMKEFGRLAFDASRKYHLHNTYEFGHYKDFLKEIEDEADNNN